MKVKLIPEDELELLSDEMGITATNLKDSGARWVVREVAKNSDDIRQLVRYNKTKTVLETYDGETSMVYESFEEVYKKWKESIPDDLNLEDVIEEEDNAINE